MLDKVHLVLAAVAFTIVTGLFTTIFLLNNDLKNSRKDVTELQLTVDAQVLQLEELEKNRKLNEEAVLQMAKDVAAIRANTNASKALIKKAVENDPLAKDWYNQPIPDSLRPEAQN